MQFFLTISSVTSSNSFISFLGCITNYYKFSSLKQYMFIFSAFLQAQLHWVVWVVSHKVKVKVLSWLCSFLEVKVFFQTHDCWLISVPCSCRTKVLISLRGCFQLLEALEVLRHLVHLTGSLIAGQLNSSKPTRFSCTNQPIRTLT